MAAPLPAAFGGEGSAGPRCNALPSHRPQGMPPNRAAPCPAWTASPASWTASPRRRSRGCHSATPTPSRPAPASTRGRERPGHRRLDGPIRRYEEQGGRHPASVTASGAAVHPRGLPPSPSRGLQSLLGPEGHSQLHLARRLPPWPGKERPAGPRPEVPSGADRPWGSGHTHYPATPAANKTCCKRAVLPASSLSAFPGIGEGSETRLWGAHQHLCSAPAQARSLLAPLCMGICLVSVVLGWEMERLARVGPGSMFLPSPMGIILRWLMEEQKCGGSNSPFHSCPATARVSFIFCKGESHIS